METLDAKIMIASKRIINDTNFKKDFFKEQELKKETDVFEDDKSLT